MSTLATQNNLDHITNPRHRSALERALELIRSNYHRTLTGSDIADATDYTDDYVTHLFTQYLGRSPFAELTRCRMAEAKRRLLLGESQQSVAKAVGYSCHGVLHYHFQYMEGMTPGRWVRKQMASGKAVAA